MIIKRILILIGMGLIWLATASSAQELSGREIMEKALHKTTWKDMQADVTLILQNPRGEQRVRKIKMFSRKRTENESDMLMRFISPPDVRNTAFLIIEHADGDDERYLYLPALRRVKRIASSGKGGNFMSSDFSYYDIGRPKLNDWTYRRLPDEVVEGFDCYKIECLPASPEISRDTGYNKIIRWIRKDILVTVQSHYFDRGNRLWKILTVPAVEEINGVWFQTDLVMQDVQTNHRSEMKFENIKVNVNLPPRFFSVRYLQRVW
ncbi:MAG: outer membrane lipoprotein-sorting protein [Calditrichaeota bacterium]|nr:outer membrane lipoprotein-sorting protein [Calditrichota bacterium]